MARVRAFRGLRPVPQQAAQVASPPYDVVNTEEARALAEGNAVSFLHVVRPEIDLPVGTDLYSDEVYETAAANLRRLEQDGVLRQDAAPCLYAYRQQMGGYVQTGLVVAASVDDYVNGVIKKHENTRKAKEDDRTRHVDTCDANAGPVFLTYRAQDSVDALIVQATAGQSTYDITVDGPSSDTAVRHTMWVVDDPSLVAEFEAAFERVPALYVADGHHRSASAARVGQLRRERAGRWTGDEPFNWFLAVLFPDSELRIMDYNRVVADLNGLSRDAFLSAVKSAGFSVEAMGETPVKPTEPHSFGMILGGAWFRLTAKVSDEVERDPVRRLDVSVLQERLLSPILGVQDPRTDARIDFIGGIRGLGALARRIEEGRAAVGFAMFPTTPAELMAIADAGRVMPPKSTWFEPKLLSGLVVHKLSEA